jgi:hypothetical protein
MASSLGDRVRGLMQRMISSSVGPMRWQVEVAGRGHVVDVIWPGFANSIAVDGTVVQTWRWPGNNLHVVRRFELAGVPCRLIRSRSGLLRYAFELCVDADGARVRQVEAPPPAPLTT